MSSKDRYILWNYILAEHCLLGDSCEGIVLLTVTPRTLSAALEEAGEGERSPEDAEADFVEAVRYVYKTHVLASSRKLRALKSSTPNDVPFGIGFLALSVLAAFHMRTDEERTGRAFYPRLAEMLGCELAGRTYPAGFEGDSFVELWDELAAWLKAQYGRDLAAPDAVGVRRYVAFPLAHVPLRQVDIERLPQFFDTYRYEPGARVPLDRLAYDLYDASGPWRQLTESGQAALADRHRRPFVVRQVAHELERWDGCRTDSSGTRIATIELWMDIRRRRAQLYLLARRPPGFPDLIEDEDLVFTSSQDCWYEPVPLTSDDGALLKEGVRVGTQSNGSRYYLQFRQTQVLPLTPSEEYTGFVSDRVLRADTECAVLCVESLVDQVARHLQALNHAPVHQRRDETIPAGWCLFTGVRAVNECRPPPGLENLGVESSLALIPEGGLRLGRRWTWLESAPARLTVLGSHHGLSARVDGEEVGLNDGGRIETERLGSPGQHIVEVGNRLRQRVIVLQGAVHPDCRPWLHASNDRPIPVAVPAGHWIILGKGPGESEGVAAPPGGALVRPTFRARWAVRVGSGPGAIALHVHDHGSGAHEPAGARGASWVETVYQASIRHPNLLCPHGCESEQLRAEWRQMMESASAIKRERRRRR